MVRVSTAILIGRWFASFTFFQRFDWKIAGIDCPVTFQTCLPKEHIVIALEEMRSSAVLRLLFFCEVTVGVGESDKRE